MIVAVVPVAIMGLVNTANEGLEPQTFSLPQTPTCMAAGDFDGDGDLDLAVATGTDAPAGLSVFWNDGTRKFVEPERLQNVERSFELISADFDRDGHAELLSLKSGKRLLIDAISPGPSISREWKTTLPFAFSQLPVVAYMDGDNFPDLCGYLEGCPIVMINDGAGRLSRLRALGRTGAGAVVGTTLDGTTPEVVIGVVGMPAVGPESTLRRSTSDVAWPFLPAIRLLAGDFDGDGKVDIAAVSRAAAGIMFGDGRGGLPYLAYREFRGGSDAIDAGAGDANGDGVLDIAVLIPAQDTSKVLCYISGPDGPSDEPARLHVGGRASRLLVVSLGGDGRADVVILNSDAKNVLVYLDPFAQHDDQPISPADQ